MEMSPETIKALLAAFDRSEWREMIVTIGEDRLHVSRDPLPEAPSHPSLPAAAPAPAPSPASEPAALPTAGATEPVPAPSAAEPPPAPSAAEVAHGGTLIESPSVGLFWRAPSPGAPPFVEVGGRVEAGETVAIVEVMKLMNHVPSPVSGTVRKILVENGAPVEFGQPIVVVDPDA